MKEIRVSDGELDELILIMQMSGYDADAAIDQSHDMEEIKALRTHEKTVQKWLNYFQSVRAKKEN